MNKHIKFGFKFTGWLYLAYTIILGSVYGLIQSIEYLDNIIPSKYIGIGLLIVSLTSLFVTMGYCISKLDE